MPVNKSLNQKSLWKWGAWTLLLLEQVLVALFLALLSHETYKVIKIEFGEYHPGIMVVMGVGFWPQFTLILFLFVSPLLLLMSLRVGKNLGFLTSFLWATVGWLLMLLPILVVILWPLVYIYLCKY